MKLTPEQYKKFLIEHIDNLFWNEEEQEAFLASGDKTLNTKQECGYFISFKNGEIEVIENTQKQYSFLTIKQAYELLKKELPKQNFTVNDIYSLSRVGILPFIVIGKSYIIDRKQIDNLIKYIKQI
ncbi:MAG: helix-turn-helix domain-containing protein [Candidatus Cloacimonetes bacterium]|nr:helix-turn-helix domain-containing protein [Candidatus Cloacimonadota bacterium]